MCSSVFRKYWWEIQRINRHVFEEKKNQTFIDYLIILESAEAFDGIFTDLDM